MRGAAGLQSAMDRSVGGRGSETRWRPRPAIWVILSARWAGSSMAEQLTLNQLVGSSSLPRLTSTLFAATSRAPSGHAAIRRDGDGSATSTLRRAAHPRV